MERAPRPVKTLKVKKKTVKPFLELPHSPRTLKVARKLPSSVKNFPLPSSIQEDFILESDEHPSRFLSSISANPEYELCIKQHRSLSPTDIVGPKNRFQVKVQLGPVPKSIIKQHLTMKRATIKPQTPSLDQKIQERSKKFNEDYEKKLKTIDSVPEKTFYRQTLSLEKYKQQVNYWNSLEMNIADKLSKNPEELQLNSARIYNAKQREVDIIDRLHKTNEVPERGYWRESLRTETEAEKFYRHVSPEVRLDSHLSEKYKTELLYYTRTSNFGRKLLKGSEYFQEKLRLYDRGTEEIRNYVDGEELAVNGVNKIRLEFEAVKRVGQRCVVLPPLEMFNEQIIEKHYEPKVLPIGKNN